MEARVKDASLDPVTLEVIRNALPAISNEMAADLQRTSYNMMIYEVDIPAETDQQAFREALYHRAGELGLDISLQHRDIFEMIHSV